VRNFVFAGLIPLVGGGMMAYVAVKAYDYYSTAGNNYSKPILGIQTPIFIGVGGLVLGIILMIVCIPVYRGYFARRPETADPRVLSEDRVVTLPGEPTG
jgi:hypothetical protein